MKNCQKLFKNKDERVPPTPEQIIVATAIIRKGWDERMRQSRWVGGKGLVYPDIQKGS